MKQPCVNIVFFLIGQLVTTSRNSNSLYSIFVLSLTYNSDKYQKSFRLLCFVTFPFFPKDFLIAYLSLSSFSLLVSFNTVTLHFCFCENFSLYFSRLAVKAHFLGIYQSLFLFSCEGEGADEFVLGPWKKR